MEKFTVLAVDDEELSLESLKRVFKKEKNLIFLQSSNPVEALKIVKQQPIDIIIADQRMPEMTGVELLRKVLKFSPATIRIVLTAYTETDDILDAINLGHVYGYIVKPWNPEELLSKIKQACQYRTLLVENRILAEELSTINELLQKNNEELQKFGELKNQFMLVASHELRTPATIISGSLELLSTQSDNFNVSQRKVLQNAIKGSLRLNDIIQTFFDSVQFRRDRAVLNPTRVDLNQLIELAVNRFQPYWDQRKLKLKVQLQKDLSIMGDQSKLYLVFENLLSNSIKYTPDGGKITIKGKREPENIRLSVIDSGIGIPEDEQNKIFDTFYQLHNVHYHHTSNYEFLGGGAGLGLSLCKSIIEAHHGKIWVESEGNNKGSQFYIELPLWESNVE
jgi:signal transduction histidine kinase